MTLAPDPVGTLQGNFPSLKQCSVGVTCLRSCDPGGFELPFFRVPGARLTARLDFPHMQIIFMDLIIYYSMDTITR